MLSRLLAVNSGVFARQAVRFSTVRGLSSQPVSGEDPLARETDVADDISMISRFEESHLAAPSQVDEKPVATKAENQATPIPRPNDFAF